MGFDTIEINLVITLDPKGKLLVFFHDRAGIDTRLV